MRRGTNTGFTSGKVELRNSFAWKGDSPEFRLLYFRLFLNALVLQCQLWYAASSAEHLYYPRPEPFFAPFAVPTVERAVWPKLFFW